MCSRRAKRRRLNRKCWCCENTRKVWVLHLEDGRFLPATLEPCTICKKKVEPEL